MQFKEIDQLRKKIEQILHDNKAVNVKSINLKDKTPIADFMIIAKQNPLKQKPYLSIKTRMNLSKGMTKSQKKIFVEYLDDKIKSRNTFDLLNFLKKKKQKNKIIFFNWR